MEQHKGIVLLVEDNVDLNRANARALELRGYEVYTALTIDVARRHLLSISPDIILLDVMLPDGSGFDFCKEIRDDTQAHILFLTAKASHEDMMQGMSIGGDAYITKPFHPEEMLVKVDAAMRRHGTDKVQLIKKGNLTLDVLAMQALDNDESLGLTPTEFSLLLLLVKNENHHVRADFIYETIWNAPAISDKNALQTAISKLRRKLEPAGYTITVQRGQGYAFQNIPV
ncbi:MAG: response regulator transcription factor [Defluviitaleaceae bacterium]|nr:response regulator transcription factor [Defluviitaleaceae bacterium]